MNKRVLSEALAKALGQKTIAKRMGSKGQAIEYLKAVKHHKKRPVYTPKPKKDSEYKHLSIEEYEKKYPSFND